LISTDAGVQLGAVTPIPVTTDHQPKGRVQVLVVEDDLDTMNARLEEIAKDKKAKLEKLKIKQRVRVDEARLKRISEFTKSLR